MKKQITCHHSKHILKDGYIKSSQLVVTAFVASMLLGCVTGGGEKGDYVDGESNKALSVGDTYGETPPRLVRENVLWGGKSEQRIAWSSTRAFGPVPQNLQQTGDKICQSVGAEEAVGYHPLAEDLQGKPIKGGGFFCY